MRGLRRMPPLLVDPEFREPKSRDVKPLNVGTWVAIDQNHLCRGALLGKSTDPRDGDRR